MFLLHYASIAWDRCVSSTLEFNAWLPIEVCGREAARCRCCCCRFAPWSSYRPRDLWLIDWRMTIRSQIAFCSFPSTSNATLWGFYKLKVTFFNIITLSKCEQFTDCFVYSCACVVTVVTVWKKSTICDAASNSSTLCNYSRKAHYITRSPAVARKADRTP